jgi:hypothetical protein
MVGPISSPFSKHFLVFSSMSHRSTHSLRHFSKAKVGITTTPSASPTMISPGLMLRGSARVSDVNWTGTFKPEERVNVFDPRMDIPLANNFTVINIHHLKADEGTTYWKPQVSMFIHISKITINDNTLSAQLLRSGTHQRTPASGI